MKIILIKRCPRCPFFTQQVSTNNLSVSYCAYDKDDLRVIYNLDTVDGECKLNDAKAIYYIEDSQ